MKRQLNKTLRLASVLVLFCSSAAWGFYDPTLQRWINRDPLYERGDENLYRFSANAPTWLIDSDGRQILLAPVETYARIGIECGELTRPVGPGLTPPVPIVGPQPG